MHSCGREGDPVSLSSLCRLLYVEDSSRHLQEVKNDYLDNRFACCAFVRDIQYYSQQQFLSTREAALRGRYEGIHILASLLIQAISYLYMHVLRK